MPHITLDDVDYPALEDDMTLDEAVWFFNIAGVGPEILDELERTKKFHPPATKAMVCLMVARQRSEVPHGEIEDRIGTLTLTELNAMFEKMLGDVKAEQSPPAQSLPESGSTEPLGSIEPLESSGEPGNGDSDGSPDAAAPSPTGFPRSDTISAYDREIAVGLHRVN